MTNPVSKGGLVGWFALNPVAANLLMLLVIVLGILEVTHLRKEAFPSMEPDSITVAMTYNSGSAEQSEEGLAIKIEDQLDNVSGIKSITSISTGNGTTVTIEKLSDYDLSTLLNDVKTQVDAISSFPADADKPVIEKATREEHALWIQLYGNTDRQTLQQLAYRLKRDLLSQAAISSVDISGWLDPMMVVEVDEERLQAYGLSLSDIEDVINNNSTSTTTATLSNKQLYLQLKASEQAYLKQEFSSIPLVTDESGRQVMLGNVATIRDTFDDDTSALSRFQGETSLALEVITTGQDDITNSVNAANQVVDQWIEAGNLPQGVELETWYDRSTTISDRLSLMVKNALTGIVLVFILLALFLNLTVAFWVAMGLPFIFFGTLYFMGDSFMGLSLNEFTTFGFILALGIVVDDAVVVGESIYSVRSKEGDTLANTIKGTLLVAKPTLFGVFTTIAAFYTLSQISGGLGKLYAQFAAVVAICLVLSIIESKLILPAHLAHLNTRKKASSFFLLRGWQTVQGYADAGMMFLTHKLYRPLIEVALHHRYAITVGFIALFILVMLMPFTGAVKMSFFPEIAGDTVRAELTMQTDATFGMTHDTLNWLENTAYKTDSELRNGTNKSPAHVEANNATQADSTASESAIAHLQVISEADQSGKVTVELTTDAPYDINQFTQAWSQNAGVPSGVKTLRIQNSPGMVDALRIELRSDDSDLLTQAGESLKLKLESVAAISGIEDSLAPSQPQLKLELTQEGRALGFTTQMLATQVLQAFKGQAVQKFQRNSDEVEVRVRYPSNDRQTTADVLNANVRTSDGTVVPLSSVATLTFGYTQDSITRIDHKRAAYMSANVDKDITSSTELVTELQASLIPDLLREYPGLDIHFGGEAEQQAETQSSMASMFLLAMLIIYMLLAIPLKSYIQPVLIMTAIPFGVVGAILGHWMNDLSLGILSLNGIIALSGVVVNDSLLLVSRFNDLRDEHANLHDAICEACCGRLRAVLLTSFTTFAGLIPLLGETSMQAQFLIPAAVSLGYGIMFATLITLILIPAILMIQEDASRLLNRVRHSLTSTTTEPTC